MDVVTLGMAGADARKKYERGARATPVGVADHPTLVKPLTGPLITFASQPAESMYWPWLVDLSADGVGTGWAWLYSTDHAATHAVSGLYAITMPNPFTVGGNVGRVYRDDTSGDQTETPSVVGFDKATGQWRVLHQQGGPSGARAEQATILCTAPAGGLLDGTKWTRRGIVMDAPTAATPIPGAATHQGYAHPYAYGGIHYASNLCGGSNYGGQQQQRSYDGGLTWTPSGRYPTQGPALRNIAGYDPATWVINWTWGNIVDWRGRPWIIVPAGPIASGTSQPAPRRMLTAPLDDELRRPTAPFIDITPPAQAWETSPIDTVGNLVNYNGRLLMPYRSNFKTGAFSLMEVV